MQNKKQSQFILYSSSGRIFTFKLNSWKKRFFSILLLGCLVIVGYYITFAFQSIAYFLLNKHAEIKSCYLKKELIKSKTEIFDQEKVVHNFFKDDDRIRKIIGIKHLSNEIKQMGTGGPYSPYNEKDIFSDSIILQALSFKDQTDKLVRQNQVQHTSLSQLQSHLQNKLNYYNHLPSIWPVNGFILSGFGNRTHPIFNDIRFHNGVDIASEPWTPVYASANGIAQNPPISSSYGIYVIINHYNGYSTVYAHLNSSNVSEGQFVKRGELIGFVGETGLTTGPHLHYEIRFRNNPIDPISYLLPKNYSID